MKKSRLYKLLEKIVFYYKKHYEKYALEKIGSKGDGCTIEYPVMLGSPELINIGNKVHILSNSRICCYPELTGKECRILIDDNTWIGRNFMALAGDDINIGRDVIVADNVSIISENHGTDAESELPYSKQKLQSAAIDIGEGCWIGTNVVVLSGVKIGKKCVIGAGSVVTKSIEPYSVAVGNPAKVIKRYNFDSHRWEHI